VGSEILIAELGETAFESFTETETGVSAFVQKELWDGTILENIRILKSAEFKIEYTYEEIDPINWNEEWEKNFEAIDVEGAMYAPFHPKLMLNLTF
jgi:ribosomal protein L11 methyltransferase